MNEFIEQFLIEGRELVAQGNDDLLGLEENPHDRARLDGAFRAFHTLKGAAGIVDFAAMSRALHAGEDVLSSVRSGSTVMTRAVTDLCLACLDQVSAWLDEMQATGEVPQRAEARAEEVVQRFALVSGSIVTPDSPAPLAATPAGGPLSAAARQLLEAQLELLLHDVPDGTASRWRSAGRVAVNAMRLSGLPAEADALEAGIEPAIAASERSRIAGPIARALGEPAANAAAPDKAGDTPAGAPSGVAAETTLRVDVGRVDDLVKLAGELTVAKNALGHSARLAQQQGDPRRLATALKEQHLQLDRLVGELQRAVVALRVLPLQHAFHRFPRLVREMAGTLGKPARLITEGGVTEADKSVVTAISEPLLHVVRNSLDHGIEDAEARAAAGKPAIATLWLRASRQGDRIAIEVQDDGRGLDLARIRAVAIERKLAPAETIAAMSDEEATGLIFAAGFSTASRVTDLSGRGVGMDVVRTTIERLGGRVAIASTPGAGTTVRFELPFTVMMTRVLTVEAGGQVFGIPLDAVVETVRVPRADLAPVGAAQAMVLRDRTLPVIDLARALGRAAPAGGAEVDVVVVRTAGLTAGLAVERLGERMDVMLTAPDGLLAGVPVIDGTTLLGDGRVLLVLDLLEILH